MTMKQRAKIPRRVPPSKVSRACVHCKAAHVTCEERRPCSRCIRRSLADSCEDAPRKQRKYLMNDDANNGTIVKAFTGAAASGTGNGNGNGNGNGDDLGLLPFMSLAAGSEDKVLGDLTDRDNLFDRGFKASTTTSSFRGSTTPEVDLDIKVEGNKGSSSGPGPTSGSGSGSGSANNVDMEPFCNNHINQYFIGTIEGMNGRRNYTFPQIVEELSEFKRLNPQIFASRNKRCGISFSLGVGDLDSNANPNSNNSNNNSGEWSLPPFSLPLPSSTSLGVPCGLLYSTPEEIYQNIKTPFLYVRPFHDLNVYLKRRFNNESLLQMSKSMAEYRPSFIATMIGLKEQDLVFAEKCFQRTLLEYNEYISINGTPTVVWRRSAQIAYVSDEFSLLTGWSKKILLDKSTFVVEIMDDKSCVEYFKLFSKLAFGDFKGATMTECTLLTPEGRGIRTSCIWTLKRDVFGIPMMIIGNFLPILT